MERFKKWIGRTLKDPRRQYGNILYCLDIILFIVLCTIMTKRDATYANMVDYGTANRAWISRFFDMPNGIPTDDTFRRVLERIDPKQLGKFLRQWMKHCIGRRAVVSVDGKTIRGSASATEKGKHIVSAFIKRNHLTLGDICVSAKSNEITAVPQLIDELALFGLRGSIITADAMSCQKAIVEKIAGKGADYVIGLKGNQESLHEDVKLYWDTFSRTLPCKEERDMEHGRYERRTYRLLTEEDDGDRLSWLCQKRQWKNLRGIGMAERAFTDADGKHRETRYFITSLTQLDEFAMAVREHWGIENNLHWTLDVVFREDSSLVKKENAPHNLNIFRKTALFLLKAVDIKNCSLDRKMYRASMSTDFLEQFLFNGKIFSEK